MSIRPSSHFSDNQHRTNKIKLNVTAYPTSSQVAWFV